MNPDFPNTPRGELEARLTALLLGELPADEATALRHALESDTELARLHDHLKETLGLVREAVASPGEPAGAQAAQLKLSEERREKLLAHFKTVKPREFTAPRRRVAPWLVPMAAAAVLVIFLALLAIPNFVKARNTSIANAVMNNLRQIDSAKQQWALEHGKSRSEVVTIEDLRPYLKGGELPRTVAGESYILGKVEEPVAAEIDADRVNEHLGRLATLLRPRGTSDGRVLLSVDGDLTLARKGSVTAGRPDQSSRELEERLVVARRALGENEKSSSTPSARFWSASEAPSNVHSLNIVGYVNKPLPVGSHAVVANPLPPSGKPQSEKSLAPITSVERQGREMLSYQAGTTVVPVSPPAAPRQQIVLPSAGDFESAGANKPTQFAAAQEPYFADPNVGALGFNHDESKQSEVASSVGDKSWFDSAEKSAGNFAYAVPPKGEQLDERIKSSGQPHAGTTAKGVAEFPTKWKSDSGIAANGSYNDFIPAPKSPPPPDSGVSENNSRMPSESRLNESLRNAGDAAALGTSPVTGLPVANQPPPALAAPASPLSAGLADSTITQPKGIELAPLPVQFPAPTLKGSPESLPSGPNIEPLGEKPASPRIIGFADSLARAEAPRPAAPEEKTLALAEQSPEQRAFAARYGLDRSQPAGGTGGGGGGGAAVAALDTLAASQPAAGQTVRVVVADGQATPPSPPPPTVAAALDVDGDKVPVLGDLPMEGRLFRSESLAKTSDSGISLRGLTTLPEQQTLLGVATLNAPQPRTPESQLERYGTEAGGISKGGRITSESKVQSFDVKDATASEPARGTMRGGAAIFLPQVAQAGTELAVSERSKADEMLRVPLRTEESLERISPGQAGEAEGAAQIREAEREVDRLRRSLEISDLDATSSTAPPAPDAEPVRQLRNELITRQTALAKDQTQLEAMAKLGAKDERVKGDLAGLSDRVAAGQAAVDLLDKELDQVQQADAANARRSRPYFEAKQRLEEMQRSRKILDNKLSSEKIDFALPRSSLVEIVDPARPATAPQKSIWGKITGRPAEFASTARIKIERDGTDVQGMTAEPNAAGAYDPYFIQTEFEVIQSDAVLGKVVDRLKLDGAWADKGGGVKQQKEQAIKQLRQELSLKPVQNTGLVEIRAKSENAEEAAKLANTVAEVYREHRLEKGRQLAQGGIKALKEQFDEQEKKVAQAKAEVERLAEDAKIDVGVAPRKSTTNAPIPQPEIQTGDNAFSTFSLNVSDVSFKLAAASLEKGQMPDAASVRSEEFINAFDYRDPEPPAGVPVAFAWERARYPFAHNRDLLRFSLKTGAVGRQAGRPLNVVLLLDNSGSMERADRVRIIREALRVLAAQLQPQDKLSVITFARTPRLWVDGVAGDKAGEVAEQVSGITPQGGTNLEEAMNLAYATALRHYLANGMNRVVVLTDGAANLGNVQPEALKQKVEAHRKQGVALDCFGIGWEGFNDDLLEVLSRNGDGRYGFINSPEEAATEFAGQLAGALQVAASDVKVQVEFNPARVTAYRQIGYAKHQLTKEQFRDNTVDAAEIAAQEAGNALYTVEVNPAGEGPLCIVRVRFKIPGTSDYREHEWAVPFSGNAVFLEEASPAMRLAASASAFSEWLVASPFAGEVTPDHLLGYLSGVPEVYGADSRPKKLEWMIRQAKSIEGK